MFSVGAVIVILTKVEGFTKAELDDLKDGLATKKLKTISLMQ